MDLVCEYSAVSGFGNERGAGIGMRFDAEVGFKPGEGECYVMAMESDGIASRYQTDGWFTGVWFSPNGTAYVAESSGSVCVWPSFPNGPVAWNKIKGLIMGVWGLRDDYVIAWGDRRRADDSVMYRWDGVAWSEMSAPSVNNIISVHGIREDLIYAVGTKGYLARWNGTQWNQLPSGTGSVLSCVHVVSEDEMYACGPGGKLLQGSIHGWTELLSGPEMYSVAKWHDEVWVAADEAGLMKVAGNKLVVVKPKMKALMLDARQDLLIAARDVLVSTNDGQVFEGVGRGYLENHTAQKDPSWR